MSIVIVGADYLGGIEKNLYAKGVKELIHITGRKAANRNKINIPKHTSFVLVLTDFVNHNTAKMIKTAAKTQEVPLVFAKRSWGAVEKQLLDAGVINA
ncbi:DUF2325 domain-containing protein [Dendrosporobacter sp. 1207_IL3150]|uniref:DUF2325 domain-containing protein n=1 Tax=Dendrosporobacter sp. 1207_IL3150 TaxID=3084054 RepID=UPI002FDA1FEC